MCAHSFSKCSFKETDEPAKANTSDLNEELGQVSMYKNGELQTNSWSKHARGEKRPQRQKSATYFQFYSLDSICLHRQNWYVNRK